MLAAGALVGVFGYSKAFPEAAIDFRVSRDGAREIAERELRLRGFDPAGYRALAVFEHDDEAKVFLERTLGLAKAAPLFGKTVPIWFWSVRFVKPLQKLEYQVRVSPSGELLAFRRLPKETEESSDPGDEAARRLAEETLHATRGVAPESLRVIERASEKRPGRVDRRFVWESETVRFPVPGAAPGTEAALRYLVEIQGDRVGRSSVFLKVPERWIESYRTLRSHNSAAGAVASFGLLASGLAVLGTLLSRARRKDVRWKSAAVFGVVAIALQFASSLNELPLALYSYSTTESWGIEVAKAVVGGLGGAVLLGVVLFVLAAGGEPLYREAYPDRPALSRIFSKRALGTRPFFRGVVLGYALTAAFFAYQIVFYLVAERFGAWAPAEVPYSNLLGTPFPFVAVLLMGFWPAASEEFLSRMFSIPFFSRFLPPWAAVALPALIWGFAHSGYPNQPFYIRGLEVGLCGIVLGVILKREGLFPLLVWHFTVDAVYTALILIRSSNAFFAVSGLLAALCLLGPLFVSIALYLRRGGFARDGELLNGAIGTAPALPRPDEAPPASFSGALPVRRRLLLSVLALSLVAIATSRLLPRVASDSESFAVGRREARSLAREFVLRQGDDPERYLGVAFTGTALPAIEEASDSGARLIPYEWAEDTEAWLLSRGGVPLVRDFLAGVLPGPVWQVRFVRFGDRHGWWVALHAGTGKIVGFRRSLPEDEPGATLDGKAAEEKARAVVESMVLALGASEPERFKAAPSLRLVSATAENRKARRDHRVVFESLEPSTRAGEGRHYFFVALAGDRPTLAATALKLPEEWLRAREKWRRAGYVSFVWKVLGIGTLVGLCLVELCLLAFRGRIPWRRAWPVALWLTLLSLLELAVSPPSGLRFFDPSSTSVSIFAIQTLTRVTSSLGLTFLFSLLATGVVLAVRPDALAAFRRHGSEPASRRTFGPLWRAGAAVFLVQAVRAIVATLGAAWPVEMGFPNLSAPLGVEGAFPLAALLVKTVRTLTLLAAAGALLHLVRKSFETHRVARWVLPLLAAGAFAPLTPRSASELLVPVLASLLVLGAHVAAIVVLLRDDPRSYVLTALLLVLVRDVPPLFANGIPWWALNAAAFGLLAAYLSIRFGSARPNGDRPSDTIKGSISDAA